MGDDVVVVPNSAGIVGGVRAWSLLGASAQAPADDGRPAR